MSYETLIVENNDGVMTVKLNRPEKLNAINPTMFRELVSVVQQAGEDSDVRVFVITGVGRAFCSSFDVDEMGDADQGFYVKTVEDKRQFFRHYPQQMTLGLHKMEKPTIALVNGLAIGVAVDWVLSCDIRIGSPNARFMNAFGLMGLFPNTGATWLWPRAMGTARALEYLYTCDWIQADEAKELGILNRVVAAEEIEAFTSGMAQRIAAGPPIVMRMLKNAVNSGQYSTLESHLDLCANYEAITDSSLDHLEAVNAWKEKRTAVFKGE